MRFLIALALLGAAALPDQKLDQLSGAWQGYWSKAGDSLFVTVDVQIDRGGNYSATFNSDRLRVSGVPFNEVRLEGCCDVQMTLRGDRSTAIFNGKVEDDSLTGTLQEGESKGSFAYSRTMRAPPTFEERKVTFASDSVTLAGNILLPQTGDSLRGVVFLHGSGAEGRWASRYLAIQLANHGIASLIFDKRGVGASSGDWRSATLEDLAADGAAAVARLQEDPRIDKRRVGIHGHSQGGTLAPLVAARSTRVAFVIASAAAGVPTDSTEVFSSLNSVLPKATSAKDSADAKTYVNELVAVAYHERPRARLDSLVTALRDRSWFVAPPPPEDNYWSFSAMFGKYQPLEWWSQIRVPVLLVYGSADQRVPAKPSAERIAAVLHNAGNNEVTVQIHPDADHTFRLPPGPSGWPKTAPDYIPGLLEWIKKR